MARCGCGSTGATGAAMESTDCLNVTGAGTALDPFAPTLVLDSASDNLLVCGVDGLYARAPVQTATDESLVITGGVVEGDYDYAVQISDDAGQGISVRDDGLYARQGVDVVQGSSTLFGGALPADPNWVKEAGTYVGTSDVNGHITVPIFVDLLGILSIVWCIGDRPISHTEANMDMGSVGLSSFDIVVEDAAAYGTPIAGGTYRINYEVTGWYAA